MANDFSLKLRLNMSRVAVIIVRQIIRLSELHTLLSVYKCRKTGELSA